MLYPSDPVSIRQIRQAELADQAEADRRRHLAAARSRDRTVWSRLLHRRHADRGPLDPSLEPFAGLDRRTLRRLERHLMIIELAPGDSLGRQGETASEFVIVLAGRIGVSLDGMPLTILDPGSQFGALPLLDGGPGRFRRASFDVLEPSRVAIADRRQFFEIIETFPVIGERIRRIAEIRRAYLAGHADARSIEIDRVEHPFPVHLTDHAT